MTCFFSSKKGQEAKSRSFCCTMSLSMEACKHDSVSTPTLIFNIFFEAPIISQKPFFWCNQLRHKTHGWMPAWPKSIFSKVSSTTVLPGWDLQPSGQNLAWKKRIGQTWSGPKNEHKIFGPSWQPVNKKPGSFFKFEDVVYVISMEYIDLQT